MSENPMTLTNDPRAASSSDVPCRVASRSLDLSLVKALSVALACASCVKPASPPAADTLDPALVAQGRTIFRYATFGDESFWTDTLRLNEVIRTAVDPTTALSVGLKVDTDSLPAAVVKGIQDGSISLKSP